MATILRAPYQLLWTQGEKTRVDLNAGKILSYQGWMAAGWFQNIAQLGSAFRAPWATRTIRVVAWVNVPLMWVTAASTIGYASAEALVNLRVQDGSRLIASDRQSLARAISFLWVSHYSGSRRLMLATEFSGGGNREYSAHVNVETWVGAGGHAVAVSNVEAIVEHIEIQFI